MGLQHATYLIEAAPDWAAVGAALEASMGVRVRVVQTSTDVALVRARTVAGEADLSFAGGQLAWDAPLNANPYFLAHLHDALVGAGARPLRQPAPMSESLRVPWRALTLRQRVAYGLAGKGALAVLWVAMLPLLLVGLVVANLVLIGRKLVRRLRTP